MANDNLVFGILLAVLIGGPVLGIGSCVVNGCAPNYSRGEREGLVYKSSEKGLFFKSQDIEVALGTGNANIVQKFSTRDASLVDGLNRSLGKSCVLRYREWLIQPITLSDSHELLSIECK